MTSLEELDLSDCTALEHLPETLGKLTKLERLDVSDCPSLTALPLSIGALTKLRCRTDDHGRKAATLACLRVSHCRLLFQRGYQMHLII